MDEQNPRPGRSWRGFLKEYAIIVIGVLTALAAQQAAEWWNWRNQVADARGVIATELANNVRQATYRLRSAACVERRLDALAVILDGAAKTGSLPPVGDIASPPRGFWPSGAWESLVASQTATHFPRPMLTQLTIAYQMVTRLNEISTIEVAAWSGLYAMVGPGRRLDPAGEERIRDALSQVRSASRAMVITSGLLIGNIKTMGLVFSPEDRALIAQGEKAPLHDEARRGFGAICAPIGAVPPHFGQGLFSYLPATMDGPAMTRPDFFGTPSRH